MTRFKENIHFGTVDTFIISYQFYNGDNCHSLIFHVWKFHNYHEYF